MQAFLSVVVWVVLAYIFATGVLSLLFLAMNARSVGKAGDKLPFLGYSRYTDPESVVPVSILVPIEVGNEPEKTADHVAKLLALRLPEHEVVAVCVDTDRPVLDALHARFGLVAVQQPFKRSLPTAPVSTVYRSAAAPNLVVLAKPEAGRADALNAGLNICIYPVYLTLPVGVTPKDTAIVRFVLPMLRDYHVKGVCSAVYADGDGTVLTELENIETMRTLYSDGRSAFGSLGYTPMPLGTVTAFQKRAVLYAGGYRPGMDGPAGEDLDLFLRIRRQRGDENSDDRTIFMPGQLCERQPVRTAGLLLRRYGRSQKGFADAAAKHVSMLLRPRYGAVGMAYLPWFWLFGIIGPFVQVLGVAAAVLALALGVLDAGIFVAIAALAVLFGASTTAGCLALHQGAYGGPMTAGGFFRMVGCVLLDNFGFHLILSTAKIAGLFRKSRNQQSFN